MACAPAALRRAERRGDSARPAGGRAVRPRTRRLHRRQHAAPRSLRGSARRHAVPGRDRRHADRAADPPVARAGRRQLLPRGRRPAGARGRAHRRGHPPAAGAAGGAGPVPRGSVPPPECDPAAPAALARAHRGHSGAGQSLPDGQRPRAGRAGQAPDARGAGGADPVRLPRQRASAGEFLSLADRDGAGATVEPADLPPEIRAVDSQQASGAPATQRPPVAAIGTVLPTAMPAQAEPDAATPRNWQDPCCATRSIGWSAASLPSWPR